MTRDQMIDEGWFGPKVARPARRAPGRRRAGRPRGTSPSTIPPTRGPFELIGRHGSLTAAEMRVPLLVASALTRADRCGRIVAAMSDTTPSSDRPRCTGRRRPVIRSRPVESRSRAHPSDAGRTGRGAAEIESPAKIIRIGSMIKQLLEEVRNTQLDEAAREQLQEIYETSIDELGSALSPDWRGELERLALAFDGDAIPTEAELRMAQAQLVGWLEGLFHGIQATLFAQQMAARQQLEDMRGELPEGAGPGSRPRPAPAYI